MASTWLGENRTCRACGAPFTVTKKDREFFINKNLELPRRCPTCRALAHGPSASGARGTTLPIEVGTVKASVGDFGFIRRDDGREDVFVHAQVLPELDALVGQRVRFTVRETLKGSRAVWAEPAIDPDAGNDRRASSARRRGVA